MIIGWSSRPQNENARTPFAESGALPIPGVGWESNGSQIGTVTVEVYEELTTYTVHVKRLLEWLKQPGRVPADELRRQKLRALVK